MNRTAWTKLFRHLKAPKMKSWYKKTIHRANRRKAKQNPDNIDKKLNTWDID